MFSKRRKKTTRKGGRAGISNQRLLIEPLEQRTLFASLAGYVYHDANYDSLITLGEHGLAGVKVSLKGTERRLEQVGKPSHHHRQLRSIPIRRAKKGRLFDQCRSAGQLCGRQRNRGNRGW